MYNGGTKYQIGERERRKGDGERERTKGKEDQCKTHVVCQRVKTNTQYNGLLQRAAVLTPCCFQQTAYHNCSTSRKNTFDFSVYSMTEFPEGCFYVG